MLTSFLRRRTDLVNESCAVSARVARRYQSGAAGSAAGGSSLEKDRLIEELDARDREVFELKRIPELSLRRVEQSQRRKLNDHEEKAVFYEQAMNRLNLDASTVTEHTYKNVQSHRDAATKMRYAWMVSNFLMAATVWAAAIWWFVYDPRRVYRARPLKIWGSTLSYRHEFPEEDDDSSAVSPASSTVASPKA